MEWRQLAHIQRGAADRLAEDRTDAMVRPACSRAYYAAYSLLADRLKPMRIAYAHGWSNPAHGDIPKYVGQIAGLPTAHRTALRRALRRLRHRREDADYRPEITVDRGMLRESLRDVAEVFRILNAGA